MLYCDECGTISDKNYGPEDGTVRCPRCAGATEEAPATSGLSLLDEPGSLKRTGFDGGNKEMTDLDLFSSETIAQKRKPKQADGETRLHLIDEATDEPAEKSDSFHTRNTPLPPPAQQWRFECLACSGSLRLEPVSQRCKIRCPRCQTWMVLETEGTLSLPATEKKSRSMANDTASHRSSADDVYDSPISETTSSTRTSSQKIVSSPSPAAVRAVDSQGSGSTDVITMAPPIEAEETLEEPQTATPIAGETDLLGQIGADPDQFGQEFDLEPVAEPESDPTSSAPTELTDGTVALWTMLFVLPSLMALLTARLAPSSEIQQLLSRVGVSFQNSCGEFLTALSGWMPGL